MADLVMAFGGDPPAGQLGSALDDLERFSQRVWDFRAGRERDDAAPPAYEREVDELVRRCAHALGLAGRQLPSCDRYDHVLVLGGGVRTARARAHFTARLLAERIEASEVSGLASLRPLNDRELRAAAEFGLPGLIHEADAMATALARALGVRVMVRERKGATGRGEHWWVRTYDAGDRLLHVVAAPSRRPGRRADTADTLAGWAELVARPASGHRVLVVTTDLFVPFQHCDAVLMLGLGYGCGVESVGFDASANQWVAPRSTASILQEVRSAIRSMQRLLRALPSTPPGG